MRRKLPFDLALNLALSGFRLRALRSTWQLPYQLDSLARKGSCRDSFILPKHRLDAKLALLLNQAANVVAKNLAERFVHHREIALRPDGIAELPLDRGPR